MSINQILLKFFSSDPDNFFHRDPDHDRKKFRINQTPENIFPAVSDPQTRPPLFIIILPQNPQFSVVTPSPAFKRS